MKTAVETFRLMRKMFEDYSSNFGKIKISKIETLDGFRLSTIEKQLINYEDIESIINNGYLDNNAKIREIRKVINNE